MCIRDSPSIFFRKEIRFTIRIRFAVLYCFIALRLRVVNQGLHLMHLSLIHIYMEQLNTIKELISQGNVEQAILLLDELLQTDFPQKDRCV